MILFLLWNVVIVVNKVNGVNQRVDPLVLIEQGLVRGQESSDGRYSSFLGIPYAKVNPENPFGPSLPAPYFEDKIFNAHNGYTKCAQKKFVDESKSLDEQTIDCLKLNIYVPLEANSRNLVPVLVWIHGGGFSVGSAGRDGVPNLVKHGIVVVMINYRLGPYGFLCLNTPLAPGNQGLKDQLEALRWVRKNIKSFGGNPHNVTLGGLSAGSFSSIVHLISNKEKLFTKVIAQRGTLLGEGLVVKGDRDAAFKLAKHLGYDTKNITQALNFLSQTPQNKVIAAFNNLGLRLRPCIENLFDGIESFLDTDPRLLNNEKKVRDTPVLIGHTNKELMGLADQLYTKTEIELIFYNKIKNNFDLSDIEITEIANSIRFFYIGHSPITTEVYSKLDEFECDFIFNHPIQRTIDKLIKENANPIYEYLFAYVGNSEAVGAKHGSDKKYLFKINDEELNKEDQYISDTMTALWANFIKYGNPTPTEGSPISMVWESVSNRSRPYLYINSNLEMRHNAFKERMAFWNLFYRIYGSKEFLPPF